MDLLGFVILAAIILLGGFAYWLHRNQQWKRNHAVLTEIMSLVMQECPDGRHHDPVDTHNLRRVCRWSWTWTNVAVVFTSRRQQLEVAIGENRFSFTRLDPATAPYILISLVRSLQLPVLEQPSAADDEEATDQDNDQSQERRIA